MGRRVPLTIMTLERPVGNALRIFLYFEIFGTFVQEENKARNTARQSQAHGRGHAKNAPDSKMLRTDG